MSRFLSVCRELQCYHTYRPAVSLAVSQRGLLALGRGRVVEVWRDVMGEGVAEEEEKQKAPYLTHRLKGEANVVEFCPFEDCLGIGHSSGFNSIIVPGKCSTVDEDDSSSVSTRILDTEHNLHVPCV